MANVVTSLDKPSNYKDSQARYDRRQQNDMLSQSTTLYVCSLHQNFDIVETPSRWSNRNGMLILATWTPGRESEFLHY